MIQNHSSNWAQEIHREPRWTCNINHSMSIEFHTKDGLALHMREEHGELFTDRQIASIVRRRSGLSVRREGICPFQCSYDATKDSSANDPYSTYTTPSLRQYSETTSSSQKRPNLVDIHGQSKRFRRVRFAEQAFKSEDAENSDDSTGKEQEGFHETVEKPLQRALSRHIATHLLSLSFLTVRFKELREQDSAHSDDVDSIKHLGSEVDDTSDASRHSRDNSELDAISLNFEDSGPLVDDAVDGTQPFGEWHEQMDSILLDPGIFQNRNVELPAPNEAPNDLWRDEHGNTDSQLLGLCRGHVFEGVPHKDPDLSVYATINPESEPFPEWDSPSGGTQALSERSRGPPAPLDLDKSMIGVGTWLSPTTSFSGAYAKDPFNDRHLESD